MEIKKFPFRCCDCCRLYWASVATHIDTSGTDIYPLWTVYEWTHTNPYHACVTFQYNSKGDWIRLLYKNKWSENVFLSLPLDQRVWRLVAAMGQSSFSFDSKSPIDCCRSNNKYNNKQNRKRNRLLCLSSSSSSSSHSTKVDGIFSVRFDSILRGQGPAFG